ncbi:hypothetical protein M2444_005391 [Paenibacillus sp. PastF-3]|nr:hypothetical protein [Paenibacillus sp. PastF-3]MDH6373559.1 hypothetical protein [Paenibacillus sp. PastF-3]
MKFNFTKQQVIIPVPLFLDENGIDTDSELVSVEIQGDKVVITYKDGEQQ